MDEEEINGVEGDIEKVIEKFDGARCKTSIERVCEQWLGSRK